MIRKDAITMNPLKSYNICEDTESEFIRSAEVCKWLGISNSQLKLLRKQNTFPVYRLGRTYLYKKQDIIDAIKLDTD